MKRSILFYLVFSIAVLAPCVIAAQAAYPYLTFQDTNGAKTSVDAANLTMTVSGTTLNAGSQAFTLSALSKMYFSEMDESTTAIENTESEQSVVAYYDLQGRLLSKDRLPAGIFVIPVTAATVENHARAKNIKRTAGAEQVLNISIGGVTYVFPAQMTGEMTFTNGTTLTVLDRTFTLGEIEQMNVSGTADNTVQVVYNENTEPAVSILADQQADSTGAYGNSSNRSLFEAALSGLILRFDSSRVTHVEIESVDGYVIAGRDTLDAGTLPMHATYTHHSVPDKHSIVTYHAADGGTFTAGRDYYVPLFPTDLYGGYRLSIFKDGLVAHYFGVHQRAEAGTFIRPLDLKENELEFDDPDAPLVEDERPGLNEETKAALAAYKRNPTEANKQALLDMMGVRYDKVVARKKAKLRELEREAHHQSLIDEMQAIVDEMVENRDIRIEQQFLRLIDPREDEDPNDAWMVLRGANGNANNPYIAYAPVTNAEYALYNTAFTYTAGQDNWPVVNISYNEAVAYCNWLSASDAQHTYRLPTEEEWILGAGHMPKDVVMNSNHVESGLTAVDAYAQTTGACGGIDFWGNCWEWTSTTNEAGQYIVKGGAWDTSRDECRTEYSDDARNGTQGYANVGFRIVRVDR